MVRLVVCDLDGTLLRPDGSVGAATRAQVQRLVSRGIPFVIATGRSWRTAQRIQSELGLTGPFVAHNGAYAYDTAGQQVLYARRVALERARAMALWASQRGIMLRYYLGVGHPVLFNLFTAEHQERFRRPEDVLCEDLHDRLPMGPLEIFLLGTWEVDSFLERFGPRGSGYEAVVFQQPPARAINVCAPGVDKVEAVAAVARRLGLHRREVLAIGDGANDLRMMRWAGASVAVGAGHEDAHRVATYVTRPDNPDPVAEALTWADRAGLLAPPAPVLPSGRRS
jgi:Cof subfamily protein (haloacid dehalogenase superfamily)